MSRNIKEIGKELMGKSLNSFHRKTGLTQLEKNNKMQDGILDGILSQVDDAYIEKTEQSNVIHLDGSGDGVVVLDSIEGNTMVNLWDNNVPWKLYTDNGNVGVNTHNFQSQLSTRLKPNTTYTYVVLGATGNIDLTRAYLGSSFIVSGGINVSNPALVTTTSNFDSSVKITPHLYPKSGTLLTEPDIQNLKILFIEGDHRGKSLNFFEGLQSSFEDKVNDEGKYEIEILSNNKNLLNLPYTNEKRLSSNKILKAEFSKDVVIGKTYTFSFDANLSGANGSRLTYCLSYGENYTDPNRIFVSVGGNGLIRPTITFTATSNKIYFIGGVIDVCDYWNFQLEENTISTDYILNKQNKIKLLINEPLRKITSNIKDRLCIKNGKLVVERKCKQVKFDGTIGISSHRYDENNQIQIIIVYSSPIISDKKNNSAYTINSTLPCITQPGYGMRTAPNFSGYVDSSAKFVGAIPNKTGRSFTDKDAENYFKENPMDVVYELEEPFYEEVLNEYGEPILLEGYENGTIYIDSTIVPTTSVRYTPKMESFKTLNEVSDNNTMLTNDVNDNIIPYMMDVDLMIMEKEMVLMSQYKIRRMGAKDMTSMQKRTQDMLERLIKGKTLTEQECKTRVTTYLNAGKITDAQAEELMLLIDEVYA